MNMKLLMVFLLGSLLGVIAAESMRQTVVMDLIEASGSDSEDSYPDYYDEEDSNSFDESSGSGDSDDEDDDDDDDLELTDDTPATTLGNNIEENDLRDKSENEIIQKDNDIEIVRSSARDDGANEISMASTSHGFFSRTEVVIAVVAGGLVGLVFAVIIVLLVMRVRKNKKGDLSYDTVKKPIYKKAPTMEA